MQALKLKIKTSVDNLKLKSKATFSKLKRQSIADFGAVTIPETVETTTATEPLSAAPAATKPSAAVASGVATAESAVVPAVAAPQTTPLDTAAPVVPAAAEPSPVADVAATVTETATASTVAPVAAAPQVSAAPVGKYNLYSRGFCPFTQQVRIALAFKGADVNFTRLLPNQALPSWWSEASPDNSVPVLQFPDGSFSNSSVGIIERLEQEFSTPTLYPAGIKAEAKEWATTIRQQLFPAFNKVLMGTNPDVQAEFRPKLKAIIDKIVDQLHKREGAYFLGTEFSIADLVLAPILQRLQLVTYFRGLDYFGDVKLQEYIETLNETPAVSSVAYPFQEMKKFFVSAIPKAKPISIGKLQHTAIRAQFDKCISEATNLSHGFVEDPAVTAVALQKRFKSLVTLVRKHSHFEDHLLYPVFDSMKPGATARPVKEHVELEATLDSFEPLFVSALERIVKGENKFGRSDDFKGLLNKLRDVAIESKIHMHSEELDIAPIAQTLDAEKEGELVAQIHREFKSINDEMLPFILDGLAPEDRMQYLHNLEKTIGASNWMDVKILVSKKLALADWNDLTFRLPALAL
ncbi:hypothetical protein BDR26DRAFT_920426 [Obelidium mucronatum]|nr:hypothetical protein BDR26DRAFT_920426 [Obelidium mucronatum]